MAYQYRNLKSPKNVESGIADFIYLAPVDDFVEGGIKCPEGPFTNPGDEVIIKETHVFKATKKFVQYALAPEKNQLGASTIGDKGFQKLNFSTTIFIPGSYAEVHEAVKNLLNTPIIALVKDSNCPSNMYYQLGCDCVFAYVSFDFSTGTTVEGQKGYTGTVTYQNGYVQLYEGGLNGGSGGGNPTNKFTAFWGWVDAEEDAPDATAIAASTHSGQFTKNGTVNADFTANADPKFLWMAEPSTEPVKTKWYADMLNNGDIGVGETFGAPTVVGAFRLYMSTFATSNQDAPIQFRVS